MAANCPECDSPIDIDQDDVDIGDELSCSECGALIRVASDSPLEFELADDDAAVVEQRKEALDQRDSTLGGIVGAHATRAGLCDARGMARPKPSAIPPDRIPPKKIPPTPEQLAKAAVAKRPAVLGRSDRVEVALRFTLSRAAMERLMRACLANASPRCRSGPARRCRSGRSRP